GSPCPTDGPGAGPSSGSSGSSSASPTRIREARPSAPPSASPSSPRLVASSWADDGRGAPAGPGRGERQQPSHAGGDRGGGRAAPGPARRLPVPSGGPACTRPAAQADRLRAGGGGGARRGDRRAPRADRARGTVARGPHVLDGGRRGAAGGRARPG